MNAIVQGKKRLLGFPVVINEDLPAGQAFMILPDKPENQTGEVELHTRSFVVVSDCELEIILEGRILTTIYFTSIHDPDHVEPDISKELKAYLDKDMQVN